MLLKSRGKFREPGEESPFAKTGVKNWGVVERDVIPPHFFKKRQAIAKEVYMQVWQTVVKP